jgi:hypothetical protein
MISDDVEVLLVVLSGNWRFPLSPFINKGGALHSDSDTDSDSDDPDWTPREEYLLKRKRK